MTLGGLAVLKVDNCRDLEFVRVLLLLSVLPAFGMAQPLGVCLICICVVLCPFVNQNINVGEKLDFAAATEI